MARGLWKFHNFCNVPYIVGQFQFLSSLIFYRIQTEPLGLFSMLCNTLRACSKKACHCHSFIWRKSSDVINLLDNSLYRQLQENILCTYFLLNFDKIWLNQHVWTSNRCGYMYFVYHSSISPTVTCCYTHLVRIQGCGISPIYQFSRNCKRVRVDGVWNACSIQCTIMCTKRLKCVKSTDFFLSK